jgi:prepilin-type N-terminal cleavage/methylation domain-containing protein
MQRVRGFTFVEIMVAVSLIAILSAIIYANFGNARAAARDDVRMSALKELQLAIELYKAQNGSYPAAGCSTVSPNWAGPGPAQESWQITCDQYIVGLVPDFIADLPTDPNSEQIAGQGFYYRTDAARTNYKMMVRNSAEVKLIDPIVGLSDDDFARCLDFSTCAGTAPSNNDARTYAVYSAGAVNW